MAGRWYAVMTHLGFVCILTGLMLAVARSGGDGFTAVRAAAPHLPPALAGTRVRARAVRVRVEGGHRAAACLAAPRPSGGAQPCVGADVGRDGEPGDLRDHPSRVRPAGRRGSAGGGCSSSALGAVSAVYGILQAAMSTDLKRLLGYSTTENMGLVLTGVGAAGLFAALRAADAGRPGAGRGAAARGRAMPRSRRCCSWRRARCCTARAPVTWTRSAGCGRGCRARPRRSHGARWPPRRCRRARRSCREWLLVQALIHGLPGAGTATAVALPVAVAAVALTAGLAVATFVKAFGTGFLARPRGDGAARAAESPAAMLAGMGLAGAACAALALVPGVVLPGISRAVAAAGTAVPRSGVRPGVRPGHAPPRRDRRSAVPAADRPRAAGGDSSPPRPGCGRCPAAGRAAPPGSGTAAPGRCRPGWSTPPRRSPSRCSGSSTTWSPRRQTSTSPTRTRRATWSRPCEYRRRVPDRIERRLYRPVLAAVGAWGTAGRRLAPGSVHRYLGYGFCTVTALLIVLAVTT